MHAYIMSNHVHRANQNELDRIEWNMIESVQSHGSGQASPKGSPVPVHGLIHISNRNEWDRIQSNRIKSVQSHGSGQVSPKGSPVPNMVWKT